VTAFDPVNNPLSIPIVQTSLFSSEDPAAHIALGRAVSSLREQNIQIIVSGMAVHNLRDLRFGFDNVPSYTKSFDQALKEAVETPTDKRDKAMVELLKRKDARQAHPTFEHLLPIHIGTGAAGNDEGRQLWTYLQGSLSWANYRFGNVPVAV
jgi:4,5-DOPA dioxygenase extradiol